MHFFTKSSLIFKIRVILIVWQPTRDGQFFRSDDSKMKKTARNIYNVLIPKFALEYHIFKNGPTMWDLQPLLYFVVGYSGIQGAADKAVLNKVQKYPCLKKIKIKTFLLAMPQWNNLSVCAD